MPARFTTFDPPAGTAPRDRRLRFALSMARLIRVGTLTMVLPDRSTHRVSASASPSAMLTIHDPRAVTRLLTGGSLGLAEAYIDGLWDSPDVLQVMALAAANEAEWDGVLRGRRLIRAIRRLARHLRPNTRRGAARNIISHYDLGNEFYAAWLDPSMTYSAALFEGGADDTLFAAQQRKMRRICDTLGLRPGMRVLEIGCGWGGFAEMAARDYGAEVVGITLSPAQLRYGLARIAEAGLADRVTLRLQDYRDVGGAFDAIVSVEMIEAVGEAYWPTYFATLRERLVPGGRAMVQAITIADRCFADYRATTDFIQRHIFPGGMLPSPAILRRETEKAGLRWEDVHWFGSDYATTLSRWQSAFQRAWPRIVTMVPGGSARAFDDRFKRLWEYYLAYCEAGFRAGWTDVGQCLLARPA
ncbi:MAG: class I SAM-dependent methyltransferase [Rhodospirillales bacterium]|nr:class I SAM-dependent methyltransferase [Rhodospirillales bacterium]